MHHGMRNGFESGFGSRRPTRRWYSHELPLGWSPDDRVSLRRAGGGHCHGTSHDRAEARSPIATPVRILSPVTDSPPL